MTGGLLPKSGRKRRLTRTVRNAKSAQMNTPQRQRLTHKHKLALCVLTPLTALLVFLPACIIIPTPGAAPSYGTRIGQKEIRAIQPGLTTRLELRKLFGTPMHTYDDLHVAQYAWGRVVAKGYGCTTPKNEGADNSFIRDEMLLVRFDEQGVVQRAEFKRLPGGDSIEKFGAKWSDATRKK